MIAGARLTAMHFAADGTIIAAMPTLIAGAVAVVVLYLLLQMFRAANPAVLARAVKIVGGVLSLAVAAYTGLRGELVVAIPLGIFGAGLLGWSPYRRVGLFQYRRHVRRRTALIGTELAGALAIPRYEFSITTAGELSGTILAGEHAGRSLGEFDLAGLLAMAPSFDAESVALLESYLDRRFPAWREHAQGNGAGGQRRAPSSGKMTAEEAYQILGLQPGASRDDIGRAHRALMKKLHPDQGGSTYLAARVNEAKDTLLRTHHS